jgi:GH24 family phage-related lysozyme (muramidase)
VSMTREQWLAEVEHRIRINEGCCATAYRDSVNVLTIGIGFNLERGDAHSALATCGVPAGNVPNVLNGTLPLSDAQINALFLYSFAPIESEARASLDDGIYDALTDARRFVLCDLVFNLGSGGWSEFVNTRALIAQAQRAKAAGAADAHDLFIQASSNLALSAWYQQVGNRARRDVAMLREGVWCIATGDGSDI